MRLNKTSLVSLLKTLLVLAVFGLHLDAKVQHEKETEPFATIPAALRPPLRQRITLSITFQRKRQWEKMYDLSIERVQRSSLSRNEFVKEQSEGDHSPNVSTLLEFTPQSAILTNEYGSVKQWTIDGCATFRRKGKVVNLKAALVAGLSDGQWYLGNLYTTHDAIDGPERTCSAKTK